MSEARGRAKWVCRAWMHQCRGAIEGKERPREDCHDDAPQRAWEMFTDYKKKASPPASEGGFGHFGRSKWRREFMDDLLTGKVRVTELVEA